MKRIIPILFALLLLSTYAYSEVAITYKVSNEVQKNYFNGKFNDLKCKMEITFTGLTLADRKKLEPLLPLNKGVDAQKKIIPYTESDTTEVLIMEITIPPLTNQNDIKLVIKERAERFIREIQNQLTPQAPEKIILEEDDIFKK